MKCTLYYRGKLKANASARDKHALRLVWSPQIWRAFRRKFGSGAREIGDLANIFDEEYARDLEHVKRGWLFYPIAGWFIHNAHVELDVLMLRPGPLGEVITQGGDIDNRMKTLFDSLQLPTEGQAQKLDQQPSGRVECCLMFDDKQISRVNIRTAQLLDVDEDSTDVVLVIDVTIVPNNDPP